MRRLDAAKTGRLLQINSLRGQAQLTLQAEGPADALVVDGALSTDGGHVDMQMQLNRLATPLRYRGTFDVADLDLTPCLKLEASSSDTGESTVGLRWGLDY